MEPAPRTAPREWHYLPRLDPACYRAFAAVLWTITFERRASGWLDAAFHAHFRECLLHAAAREGLYCPTYVLMPDHIHLVWLGTQVTSDQLKAIRFLRKYAARELARRSPTGVEFELQRQAHDSVMRERDRTRGALASSCFYVLDNPRRQGLVSHPREWPYLGAIVLGYPFLHPLADDFWPLFWKLYAKHREPTPNASPPLAGP